MKTAVLVFLFQWCITVSHSQGAKSGFRVLEKPEQKQIDILWKGHLLTAYCYYDSICKPFLFPINTLEGVTITRGYPVVPLPGEPTDHPHHTGMWMNYESVNGLDFWNNSTAIPLDKKELYGRIVHREVVKKKVSPTKALLVVSANWVGPDGKTILDEKTSFTFWVRAKKFFIDRLTILTALDQKVLFRDAKDGFLALRVAKELQMPSKEATTYVDIHGNKTRVGQGADTKATGMYYGSTGLRGDSVWSTKGPWTMLQGIKDGRNITIGILDHPRNPGYPAYWHARGYGLFAINPLGRKIFSNGKEQLNFEILPHASATFYYRVIIASEKLSAEKMQGFSQEFKMK
ncbi:MAG: hypothetical protein NVS9B7_05400 [Flavisolibacter sp.]